MYKHILVSLWHVVIRVGCCLLLFCGVVMPRDRATIHLTESSLQDALEILSGPQGGCAIAENWLYHPGDSLGWADPDYNDSGWGLINALELYSDGAEEAWSGIGWFRLHLRVDSLLWGKPLSLRVAQIGASELYLNGRLIQSLGRVGRTLDEEINHIERNPNSRTIQLDPMTTQVLAVRYSNWHAPMYERLGGHPGFVLELAPLNETIVEVSNLKLDAKAHQVGFTAACCAVALIHLLIFLFYRRGLEHLDFAIFTIGCAILTYAPFTSIEVISPVVFAVADLSFKLGLVIVGIFGLRFLYGLFYPAIPRQFWVFLAGAVLCALVSWKISVRAVYVYVIFALLEMFRVIVVAVLNKKDGSWIIGLGYVVFVLGCTYQILMEFQWAPMPPAPLQWPYMAGILAMLISMSFYLARSVAKTSLELSQQLVQVKELSDKTIEQERLAREQEVARKLLEQEIAHKARELEEAGKLQQALADLEKAHRELRETQAQLVQSEKMATMGMLVAGVAHEINTPVGAITSMHNTLVRAVARLKESFAAIPKPQGDTADLDKSLATIDDANRVIQSASERVIAIVRRLRSFARLDEAELKKVDIHEGIEDTLSLIAHELKHSVQVVREFGDVPPISCFPSRLNQVFLNLFINAKQAMQGSGKIIIKTSRDDDHVRIDISDTGPGIPKHKLDRIFDPGYTTKGVGVGTGLGLSICYQIIRDHHGEITASSETGKGATFTITLPLDLDSLLNAEQKSDGKA